VFVAGGSLWLGGFKPFPAKRGPSWGAYFATQCDLATGKVLMHIEPENPGHHHRCYSNKATDRYILGGRRGTEFIDLKSGDVLWNSCACGCYVGVKLTGFHALAPQRQKSEVRSQKSERLEKGPAYGQIGNRQSPIENSDEWPTYRHDAQRSGSTRMSVPAGLRRAWRAEFGGKLSAPTVAGGKVFMSSVDGHRILATDADSGRLTWDFTGGAGIDSPPSLYRGRVLFGCRDGYVYSVRASDGQLAWRLQAAREGRRIAACGRLESASPVIGSVLLKDDALYATAGRSSYADGGIDLYRLKPETGGILSRTPIYSPDPETGKQPKHLAPAVMLGARADILTADENCIYLRDMAFDKSGAELPEGQAHLFTLTDFLDDSWPHRSYWIFGTKCSLSTGCSGRDRKLIYGRLLVFDESKIYGYGRSQVHSRDSGTTLWQKPLKIQVRAMVLAGKVLFIAGAGAGADSEPEGRGDNKAAILMAISASDGTEMATYPLDSPPIFDGMAAAYGRLYVSMTDGSLVCMAEQK
jgi:outer membrane protein assembly factor BamB